MPKNLPLRTAIALGLVACVAVLLGAWCTASGVAFSRDSVSYVHYARVLLRQEPAKIEGQLHFALTHYPPLYPAALAALDLFGTGLLRAARVANVLCYAASIVIATHLVWCATRSAWRAGLAAVLLGVQPAFASVHLWANSEPLFIVWLLLMAHALLAYVTRPERRRTWSLLAGLTIAAATLTRYVGIAFLPAAVVTILLTETRRRAIVHIGLLAAMVLLPVVALAAVQKAVGSGVAHRSLEYHALGMRHWHGVRSTFVDWLADPEVFGKRSGLMAIVVVVMLIPLIVRRRTPIKAVILPCVAIYMTLLLVSIALVDNATPLDNRILSPIAVLLTLYVVSEARRPPGVGRAVGPVLACCVGGVVLFNGLWRSASGVTTLRDSGLGFDHVIFRASPLVAACRDLPAGAVIYSNYPEAIFLHAGRDATNLPGHATAIGRVQEPMAGELDKVRRRLGHGGYVAYFNFRVGRNAAGVAISVDELKAVVPLRLVLRTKDGTLLRSRRAETPPATQAASSP
ncbi:MAG TPA: glycosyltransferase family 39 protein [Tepidisphaeraceae bacterium]|jgi:4-amino-4-deoxy-L-arabinose transferase-like glycosyltransferase